ncbi:hypothetical protein G9272_32270 [Streptomyces asoensis]|uniref:Uncharacterized protein n=1 Tax=Streptomyces asoensis TaxID=249586 RepID=A0A6M4WYG3_9ACTN|nr:hypothetical protein [Streptomyces asoensis]QJT04395.1 hypothetical protein G9272_32270 [Streptomyces asoensis]
MSAREPEPCDGLTGEHDGPVRFYLTGWKCTAHAPRPRAREPQPAAKTT